MKRLTMIAAFGATLLLMACTEPETYPITGAPCHEDDAVQDMQPLDCLPPPAI